MRKMRKRKTRASSSVDERRRLVVVRLVVVGVGAKRRSRGRGTVRSRSVPVSDSAPELLSSSAPPRERQLRGHRLRTVVLALRQSSPLLLRGRRGRRGRRGGDNLRVRPRREAERRAARGVVARDGRSARRRSRRRRNNPAARGEHRQSRRVHAPRAAHVISTAHARRNGAHVSDVRHRRRAERRAEQRRRARASPAPRVMLLGRASAAERGSLRRRRSRRGLIRKLNPADALLSLHELASAFSLAQLLVPLHGLVDNLRRRRHGFPRSRDAKHARGSVISPGLRLLRPRLNHRAGVLRDLANGRAGRADDEPGGEQRHAKLQAAAWKPLRVNHRLLLLLHTLARSSRTRGTLTRHRAGRYRGRVRVRVRLRGGTAAAVRANAPPASATMVVARRRGAVIRARASVGEFPRGRGRVRPAEFRLGDDVVRHLRAEALPGGDGGHGRERVAARSGPDGTGG